MLICTPQIQPEILSSVLKGLSIHQDEREQLLCPATIPYHPQGDGPGWNILITPCWSCCVTWMMKSKLIGKSLLSKWCMPTIAHTVNSPDMNPITCSLDITPYCPLISCLASQQLIAVHPVNSMQRNGRDGWKKLTSWLPR